MFNSPATVAPRPFSLMSLVRPWSVRSPRMMRRWSMRYRGSTRGTDHLGGVDILIELANVITRRRASPHLPQVRVPAVTGRIASAGLQPLHPIFPAPTERGWRLQDR